jgi:hypothetical protein
MGQDCVDDAVHPKGQARRRLDSREENRTPHNRHRKGEAGQMEADTAGVQMSEVDQMEPDTAGRHCEGEDDSSHGLHIWESELAGKGDQSSGPEHIDG